jgi:hypothetical protein
VNHVAFFVRFQVQIYRRAIFGLPDSLLNFCSVQNDIPRFLLKYLFTTLSNIRAFSPNSPVSVSHFTPHRHHCCTRKSRPVGIYTHGVGTTKLGYRYYAALL